MLRDLHAGPMRFGELQAGLPGLATNLLSARLDKLQTDGLVAKVDGRYELTDSGRATDRVLWELAQLGITYPTDPDLKPQGHLRLAAVTLQSALRKAGAGGAGFVVELVLDGEPFTVDLTGDEPTVRYGDADEPAVTVTTDYEAFVAAAGGELPLERFRADHVQIDGDRTLAAHFAAIMTEVMTQSFAADP